MPSIATMIKAYEVASLFAYENHDPNKTTEYADTARMLKHIERTGNAPVPRNLNRYPRLAGSQPSVRSEG